MVKIEIKGKEYPLCLTVAALEELNVMGYDLAQLGSILSTGEGETVDAVAQRSVAVLEIFLREGKANAKLTAPDMEVAQLPTAQELPHLLTPGEVLYTVRPALTAAILEGMGRTIEAVHEKNGENAV